MRNQPRRVKINNPSILQEHYGLHGKVGIAVDEGYHSDAVRVFFTEGSIISMQIKRSNLIYLS